MDGKWKEEGVGRVGWVRAMEGGGWRQRASGYFSRSCNLNRFFFFNTHIKANYWERGNQVKVRKKSDNSFTWFPLSRFQKKVVWCQNQPLSALFANKTSACKSFLRLSNVHINHTNCTNSLLWQLIKRRFLSDELHLYELFLIWI